MKIKDVVQPCPPVAWAGSYSGSGPVGLDDPAHAIARAVTVKGNSVVLEVEDAGGHSHSVSLPIDDAQLRDRVLIAIRGRLGDKLCDLCEADV